MLDYCLDRGIELRYTELMRMGSLAKGNGFQSGFLSLQALLDIIRKEYECARTDVPYDSTSVRYQIPGRGVFGIIANVCEPFCRSCTRLRLSPDGYLYGYLRNARRQHIARWRDLASYRFCRSCRIVW